MQAIPQRSPLIDALWPAEGTFGVARNVLLAVTGSLVLWLSAKINVPFYPVPMTMQTFAVLVIGAAFGWKLGAATVLLYLAEGAAGFPVFAGTPARGIGLAYMFGPTGGYLIGFVAGAALVGWLCENGWGRGFGWLTAGMFIGHVVIFAYGLAWLASQIGFEKAWATGVAPFYLATLFKTLLAAACMRAGWAAVNQRG